MGNMHELQHDLNAAPFNSEAAWGLFNTPEGWLIGYGTTVPADASVGWAPGALFFQVDGSTEATYWYVNVGTRASSNFDAFDLNIAENALLSGITATASEINRATDLSARVVGLAVTTAITEAAHEGKTILMTGAGGARTFTLPAATGAGGRYRFVVGEVNTSGYLIKAAVGTDLFEGMIIGASTTDSQTDAARTWLSGANDDTVTLNGTTTGGAAIGDWIEFEDLSAVGWFVRGMITQSGTEATPFSDTVA